ncbi:hypothetical protein H310_14920 [Aphanomyces invadans]|uniref:DUF7164 domain-containing protein n=1 Tax=Aphanomyces invadans TaxID=157072 RepID=A0A024T8C7_9STRA|nr:hypothetical protein H310_14920 [Aphanomyces invadans]ETV90253.1 hypothetical protein H310_14920 [Aphanomyces invadans]|eukprot:XP_008881116.1 hypothetical protein H310_14920 [Aphanomyces invadans]
MIQSCGQLSMKVINHLHLHEFNETEKSHEYAMARAVGWPRWHYGVLTMYSGHLAIPNCTIATGFDKRDDLLDFPTSSNESVQRHPHVHAQQNLFYFSKVDFQEGNYDNMRLEDLDVAKRDDLLDFPTSSNESVQRHPHVHTQQNLFYFSKVDFQDGNYDNMRLEDLDVAKVNDYATYMALKSHRQYKIAMAA